jgi:acetate kinase
MGPTESDPKGNPAGKVGALHTEEDKQLARHCRALLQAGAG